MAQQQIPEFAGIDYGSKLAGTTVIAFQGASGLELAASTARRDADRFVLDWCRRYRPRRLFIDAPLSLPGVYRDLPGFDDYFYRRSDRALSAMSPMFLGGLTARAMQLRATLEREGIAVYEVYPGGLASLLGLKRDQYKQAKEHIPAVLEALAPFFPILPEAPGILTWHHVDALLAWLSGWRYGQGQHRQYGDPAESLILL